MNLPAAGVTTALEILVELKPEYWSQPAAAIDPGQLTMKRIARLRRGLKFSCPKNLSRAAVVLLLIDLKYDRIVKREKSEPVFSYSNAPRATKDAAERAGVNLPRGFRVLIDPADIASCRRD